MNRITFPLNPDSHGASLTDLHDALRFLLDKGSFPFNDAERQTFKTRLESERAANSYADTTRKLVAVFQETRQLQSTGLVDQHTADAMNALLRELGQLDSSNVVPTYIVSGRVAGDDGLPVGGRRVQAFHEAGQGVVRLGDDPTDGDGRYTIRYQPMAGINSVRLLVEVSGDAGAPALSSTVIPSAKTLEIVDFVVPVSGKSIDQHRMEGTIVFNNGLPAFGLKLRLYRIDFGGAQTQLAESTTREQGLYAFPFDLGGQRVGLEVRAVEAAGQETPLSKPLFDLGDAARLVVNLVAPARLGNQQPEFTRLAADLAPRVGGDLKNLKQAREDDGRGDLTVLHETTGWDARLIALAAKSHQLADDSGLPANVLYGLARAGLPTDATTLARMPVEALDVALQKSRDSKIVEVADADVSAFKQKFATFASQTRQKETAFGTLSTLGDLLNQSGLGLNDQQKTVFEDLHFKLGGKGEELWASAQRAGIEAPQIARLRLQGKLAYLTRNNATLTAALQGEVASMDRLGDLVDKDLHRADAWTTRLNALAGNNADALNKLIPPAYQGKSDAVRLAAYTDDLARQVRLSFPMRVVGRMIETKELNLGAEHDAVQAPVRSFLKAAEGLGFKLGQTPVESFVRSNQAALFPAAAASEITSTTQNIKRLTRLYQISPSDDAMKALASIGITSAQDVVKFSVDVFVQRFGDLFRTHEEARLVYRKAQEVSVVIHNFFGIAKQLDSAPPMHATSVPAVQREAVRNNLIKTFPTMESLFGSLDFCNCDHCQSVLSPAAYLVDLFQFLDPPDLVWTSFLGDWKEKHDQKDYIADYHYAKPFEALIERRPDLPHLALTCENTNTAMPYIDLVNEILEYYVANDKLDEKAVHDTCDATTAELLAEPQYVVPKAYETLKAARYPLSLPFDCWLETVRSFFNYFEIPFADVMEIFRTPDQPGITPADRLKNRALIFTESLGLSPSEYKLLTDSSSLDKWFELYGFVTEAEALTVANDDQGQRIDLKSAKALSRRLGVSYQELVTLVQTQFVNPRLEELTFLHKLKVSADDVFRFKGLPGHSPLTLDEKLAFEQRLQEFADSMKLPVADLMVKIDQAWADGKVDEILVLRDPDAGTNFDLTTLQFSNGTAATSLVFTKLNLFVRLWRKLGWTIEETDRALLLFAGDSSALTTTATLGAAVQSALLYLAQFRNLAARLPIGKNGRARLLTLWSDLPTSGVNPLYAQLFLTATVLKNDLAFDDPLGNYLSNASLLIKDSLLALQGALNLTIDEISQVLEDAMPDPAGQPAINVAKLTLKNVSLLHRYRWLAKSLKLSVSDFITLKSLSGLNPFSSLKAGVVAVLEDLVPFTKTLPVVEIAETLQTSRLQLADIDFLARHRFDPVGKHRPDMNALLALVKSLGDEIQRIQTANAAPADPADFTDETLAQKLGLVFPADVTAAFLAMWTQAKEYEVVRNNVPANQQLRPEDFVKDSDIQVAYRPVAQKQRVTYRGVLLDPRKQVLASRVASPLLVDMLAEVQSQARSYFVKYFQISSDPSFPLGFLKASDFDALFAPPVAMLADEDANDPAKVAAYLLARKDEERKKRKILTDAFLPFLQRKLIRQFLVQILSTSLNADPVLTESLLADLLVLPDLKESLLETFRRADQRGATAEYFASSDLTGNAIEPASQVDTIDLAKVPPGANSARIQGYVEVPAAGGYRFFASFGKQDITADVRISAVAEPLINGYKSTTAVDETSAYVELKPGVLYALTVELRGIQPGGFKLLVQGETIPKDRLSQLTMYPSATVENIRRGQTLLSKVLLIIQTFGFSEREIRHLQKNSARFEDLNFGKLPTADPDTAAAAPTKVFSQLIRLIAYASLKESLGCGADELIEIFEARTAREQIRRIAELTRRTPATVSAVVAALQLTGPIALADEQGLRRLWQAMQAVETLGIPTDAIVRATGLLADSTTPVAAFSIARELRNAVKARYADETWQRIAQPIFDKLRQQQRDALVAWILHRRGFARIDELFEYFLIDPGMEPVVQTSRLRLAISAVQTFVQRCLLNLESKVHPTALNAKHWEWMKRYRVWEANRKIFLYPENWLEPEFRDDKTFLYDELESALLQGDVSNDLAEDAFFKYLNKLDQIARLEMVSMYCEEMPDPASNIIHVFGRTHSLPHKYYYRRMAHRMWTPWEPVGVDIDGDHVVAIVWRQRLHLFWVTFMDKAAHDANAMQRTGDKQAFSAMSFNDIAGRLATAVPTKVIEAQLNWSEYHQGAWSSRESGGFGDPIRARVNENYNPLETFIYVSKEVHDGEDGAVMINLGGQIGQAFRVVSKNSPPKPIGAESLQPPPMAGLRANLATRYSGTGTLQVEFIQQTQSEDGKPATSTSTTQNLVQPPATSASFSLLVNANRGTTIDVLQAYVNVLTNHFVPGAKPALDKLMTFARSLPLRFDTPSDTVNQAVRAELGALTSETMGAVAGAYSNPQLLPAVMGYAAAVVSILAYLVNRFIQAGDMVGADEEVRADIRKYVTPFFYQDNLNAFFVEPTLTETTLDEWQDWVIPVHLPPVAQDHDWIKDLTLVAAVPKAQQLIPPIVPHQQYAKFPVENLVDWVTHPATAVSFGSGVVGQSGAIDLETKIASAGEAAVNIQDGLNVATAGNLTSLPRYNVNRAGNAGMIFRQ